MISRFDAISPLDYRFVGGDAKLQAELGPYLSAAAVIRYQARVEGALALAMADAKICDRAVADAIARAADQVTPQEVADDVDALIIATDWPEFKELDLAALCSRTRRPLMIDMKNLLDPSAAQRAGFHYLGIGRGTLYKTTIAR